ncbi:putative RNA-directed DNA polymerase from transposon BS [Trichonephila clavipes]|nr:putative RNA-directed DNA polymerase from transposon BS [Trichonephila clavipes]
MLPKAGQDHKFPQGFRPISLLSCTAKIFERIILNRIKAHCKAIDIQNKILRIIDNAPWYIRNSVIHHDLHMEPIDNYITRTSRHVFTSIQNHDNPVIRAQTLFTYPHAKLNFAYKTSKWNLPLKPPLTHHKYLITTSYNTKMPLPLVETGISEKAVSCFFLLLLLLQVLLADSILFHSGCEKKCSILSPYCVLVLLERVLGLFAPFLRSSTLALVTSLRFRSRLVSSTTCLPLPGECF